MKLLLISTVEIVYKYNNRSSKEIVANVSTIYLPKSTFFASLAQKCASVVT